MPKGEMEGKMEVSIMELYYNAKNFMIASLKATTNIILHAGFQEHFRFFACSEAYTLHLLGATPQIFLNVLLK